MLKNLTPTPPACFLSETKCSATALNYVRTALDTVQICHHPIRVCFRDKVLLAATTTVNSCYRVTDCSRHLGKYVREVGERRESLQVNQSWNSTADSMQWTPASTGSNGRGHWRPPLNGPSCLTTPVFRQMINFSLRIGTWGLPPSKLCMHHL